MYKLEDIFCIQWEMDSIENGSEGNYEEHFFKDFLSVW